MILPPLVFPGEIDTRTTAEKADPAGIGARLALCRNEKVLLNWPLNVAQVTAVAADEANRGLMSTF